MGLYWMDGYFILGSGWCIQWYYVLVGNQADYHMILTRALDGLRRFQMCLVPPFIHILISSHEANCSHHHHYIS